MQKLLLADFEPWVKYYSQEFLVPIVSAEIEGELWRKLHPFSLICLRWKVGVVVHDVTEGTR